MTLSLHVVSIVTIALKIFAYMFLWSISQCKDTKISDPVGSMRDINRYLLVSETWQM